MSFGKQWKTVPCCNHGFNREDRKHELHMKLIQDVATKFGYSEKPPAEDPIGRKQ